MRLHFPDNGQKRTLSESVLVTGNIFSYFTLVYVNAYKSPTNIRLCHDLSLGKFGLSFYPVKINSREKQESRGVRRLSFHKLTIKISFRTLEFSKPGNLTCTAFSDELKGYGFSTLGRCSPFFIGRNKKILNFFQREGRGCRLNCKGLKKPC